MKKVIVAVCLLLSAFGVAQDSKMSKEDEKKLEESLKMLFAAQIEMAIDGNVFPTNEANSYFTEDQKAGIIAMIAPKSFDKMKKDMKNQTEAVDKGEMTLNGQKVLFVKNIKEKDGEEFVVMVYCKENDPESSLMVTSFFEKDKESTIKPHAEKAIATAKLIK